MDHILGIIVGNLVGGISIGWWKRSHNVHHIVCNSIDHDPDIQHLPAMAVDEKIFKGFYSSYHSKEFIFDTISRWLVAYQHWLYYPIMGFARFNLYAQSLILLLSREAVDYKALEIACLTLFAAWVSLLTSMLPRDERLMFIIVSHFVSGVLHVQITLSHFSMNTFFGHPYTHGVENDEWFHEQVKTTMDVDCPEWMDWFHGGL